VEAQKQIPFQGEIDSLNFSPNSEAKFGDFPELFWYRGESVSTNFLNPKLLRNEGFLKSEDNLNAEFLEKFKQRTSEKLNSENYSELIPLAQHHCLPTRLLDWSGNFGTALFFACEENQDTDGSIYVLSPLLLNFWQASNEIRKIVKGDRGIINERMINWLTPHIPLHASNPILSHLFSNSLGIAKNISLSYAFNTTQGNRRVMAQEGKFVFVSGNLGLDEHLMGNFSNGVNEIQFKDKRQAIYKEQIIQRYLVPAKSKQPILKKLQILGIRRSNLFPDLDNLAKELSDKFEKKD